MKRVLWIVLLIALSVIALSLISEGLEAIHPGLKRVMQGIVLLFLSAYWIQPQIEKASGSQ